MSLLFVDDGVGVVVDGVAVVVLLMIACFVVGVVAVRDGDVAVAVVATGVVVALFVAVVAVVLA